MKEVYTMSTYAVADLHGMGELWDQIKAFLKPEDTLYCLGDCADRGPDGWRIIKEMLERPNTIYLMGNHEDMMLDATFFHDFEGNYLWMSNGGQPTLNSMQRDGFNESQKVRLQIKNLPLIAIYHNALGQDVIMTHAGCRGHINSHYTYEEWLKDLTTNVVYNRHALLWDRYHFRSKDNRVSDNNYVILHGHTPVKYLLEVLQSNHIDFSWSNYAIWYDNTTKCDIDMLSVHTGIALLIDLDTWQEHIFKGEPIL